MLRDALIVDAQGNAIRQHHKIYSESWEEIEDWSNKVYMPYSVVPTGKIVAPRSLMHSAQVGRITITRFAYGIPVNITGHLDKMANIIVLTTLEGKSRHHINKSESVEIFNNNSFILDCSNVDYDLDFDDDHLQLNITIPPDLMAQVCQDWFGFIPGDTLWLHKCAIGGAESSWLRLIEYVVSCIAEAPNQLAYGRAGRHLEQMICVHLLNEWASRAGLNLNDPSNRLAPRVVRGAEQYMADHAAELPTMTEVARAVGCSLRTLTEAFRRFRGYPPSQFLKERRLQGTRRDLLNDQCPNAVADIAAAWGFISMSEFAKIYRMRFHEKPSETLRKR